MYSEGLIYGGKFGFKIDWASLILGSKFTVFALLFGRGPNRVIETACFDANVQ